MLTLNTELSAEGGPKSRTEAEMHPPVVLQRVRIAIRTSQVQTRSNEHGFEQFAGDTGYILSVSRERRDWLGSGLGFVAFLGGIGLLLLTFDIAYQMFHTPPNKVLDIIPGKTLQIAEVGTSLAGVIIRIALLLVMGLMGSLIANRGILLIGHSRPRHPRPPADHE